MRILFVGMAHVIHTANWINQLADSGWELHLFSVTPFGVYPDLAKSVVVHERAVTWPHTPAEHQALADHLARTIRDVQPDLIHSLSLQQGSTLTLTAKERLGGIFPVWCFSSWGGCLHYYGRVQGHRQELLDVLAACDYHLADSDRDVELARHFGFRGGELPKLSASGGLDPARFWRLRQPGPASARRLIVLNGEQHGVARAHTAMRAVERCADLIRDRYEVAMNNLTDYSVEAVAELVSERTGIPFTIVPHSTHDEILALFGRARVGIRLKITDGTSRAFIEYMAMGALPIHSDNGVEREWATHGETALFAHPDDADEVAAALRRALLDDVLVDRAAETNFRTIADRLDLAVVRPQVIAMYQQIAAESAERMALWHAVALPDVVEVPEQAVPDLTAEFSGAPRHWVRDRPQVYTITLTNLGPMTWCAHGKHRVRLGAHFGGERYERVGPGPDGTVADDRFDLPHDVPWGESVELTVCLTAPVAPGRYVIRHRLLQEGVCWSDAWHEVDVIVV